MDSHLTRMPLGRWSLAFAPVVGVMGMIGCATPESPYEPKPNMAALPFLRASSSPASASVGRFIAFLIVIAAHGNVGR